MTDGRRARSPCYHGQTLAELATRGRDPFGSREV